MLTPALRHELSFWHGRDRLHGDLVVPPRPGPHPVVLSVGESEEIDRDHAVWLDEFAAAGYACFTWDRPRPGPTTVDPTRRVAQHAREVLSALKRLRSDPHVDAERATVLGWGDGGWAAAQATTFSSSIGALVLAGTPTAPGSESLPTLSAVAVPVLALFGEHDDRLPLRESVRGVRQVLQEAAHHDHEVAVIRGGDHALRVRPRHGLGLLEGGRHQFGDWPAGLTSLIVEWLDARVRVLADVPAFAPPAVAPSPGGGAAAPMRLFPAARFAPRPVPVRQVRRRISR